MKRARFERRGVHAEPRIWSLSPSAARGLTVMELLTWFGIFMIACAVSTPSLVKLMDTYHLHGAARRVYAEMQSLRVSAVASNTRYRSAVDAEGLHLGRFDLETGEWQDLGPSPAELSAVEVSASGEIVFAPNGTAPSPGIITLTNSNGAQKTVIVNSAGLVRIH
jgi:Tfp pilus assembly protein FimT